MARRTKRVTDPFDDKVKSRIFGREPLEAVYSSSGSEHNAENDGVESPCLSYLLYGFLDEDAGGPLPPADDPDSGHDYDYHRKDEIEDLLHLMAENTVDAFRNVLVHQVSKAMEIFSFVKSTNKSLLRRNVMVFLRSSGYNAAICKTKWESSGVLTALSYEFIDVIRSDTGNENTTRYIIDIDFAGEFEIARQTNQYDHLIGILPRVFIGKSENLKQIVKLMSDAARRSLKSRGLHLPPWRKNPFMQNKWFGPYRRTVNMVPENSSSLSTPATETFPAKCRSVGFDAVNNSCSFFPVPVPDRI